MSDIQDILKSIQQDKSKSNEISDSEVIDDMINMVISKPYNDQSTYYGEGPLDKVIPDCYKDIKFKDDKFSLYCDETLFYIFYCFPSDEVQVQAYRHLIGKGYKYSKIYRCFVKIEDNIVVDNSKHTIITFDPFNWIKTNKEVLFDDKFISTLEPQENKRV